MQEKGGEAMPRGRKVNGERRREGRDGLALEKGARIREKGGRDGVAWEIGGWKMRSLKMAAGDSKPTA